MVSQREKNPGAGAPSVVARIFFTFSSNKSANSEADSDVPGAARRALQRTASMSRCISFGFFGALTRISQVVREFCTKHSRKSLGLYRKRAKKWGSSLIFLLKALEGVFAPVMEIKPNRVSLR